MQKIKGLFQGVNDNAGDKYLIVGLGNPGAKYKETRHNIGFQIMNHLAARHGMTFSRKQGNAFIATGRIAGASVVLAKPQTYMNNSGRAVGALKKFYKIPNERIIIVFDDIDLPPGTLRMRPEGGSGGQNGIKSIIQHLGGNKNFPRLRVGIGRPPGKMGAAAYVLQKYKQAQMPLITETYDRASDAVETWLSDGIQLAMSRHNGPAPE